MKILYLHVTQELGGVEKRFFNYYKYILQKNDNNYTVFISKTFLHKIGVELQATKGNKIIKYGWRWNTTCRLSRYIDYFSLLFHLFMVMYEKYDVIHYPTSASGLFSNVLFSRYKVFSVVNSHKEELHRQIESNIFRGYVKCGFYIDCLDENIRNAIVSLYPHCSQRVFVSPCSFIPYENTDCDYEKKEHAVCFVGRLIAYKGADLLRDSILEIVNKTKFKIYVLGKGNLKNEILEIVNNNNLTGRVFVGYCSSPIEYMKKTKIFLSLQNDENYPSQSLIEAMATKNAIIATDVGLTSKIVHEEWGILIKNKEELINGLVELEKQNMHTMGELAMKFVREKHNVEQFHHYMQTMYKSFVINPDV